MPTFDLTSPDGRKVRVTAPEGASHADVIEYAKSKLAEQVETDDAPKASYGEGAARTAADAALFGGGSQLAGLIAAGYGGVRGLFDPRVKTSQIPDVMRTMYKGEESRARGIEQGFAEENPWTAAGIGVAGALPTAGAVAAKAIPGLMKAGLSAPKALGLTAVGEGAVTGALTADPDDIGKGAALGAGLGLAGTGVAKVAQRVAQGVADSKMVSQAIKEAPTQQDLRVIGNELFNKAERSGVSVKGEHFGAFSNGLQSKLREAGFSTRLHPKVSGALEEFKAAASGDLGVKDLQIMRRIAGSAAGSIEPDERRLGSIMIDEIDDYVSRLGSGALRSGDVGTVSSDLANARNVWGRMRRLEIVDDIFENAQNQASGFENGLRIGFRQLLKNKKKMRGFSPEERKAMEAVVQGTATSNTLKRLGKLGFGSAQQTNVLGGTAGVGLGGVALGTPGAMAVPLLAYGAQKTGEGMTRRGAQAARAAVASGHPIQRGTPAYDLLRTAPYLAPTSTYLLNPYGE